MTALVAYAEQNEIPRREREVFDLVRKGHSLRFIARSLKIRRESARSYWRRTLARIGR